VGPQKLSLFAGGPEGCDFCCSSFNSEAKTNKHIFIDFDKVFLSAVKYGKLRKAALVG